MDKPLPEFTRTVIIPCPLGLHLRVTARVVAIAKRFESTIWFTSGRLRVDAKSILGMLMLGASRGKELVLRASGPDAEGAVQVIGDLFNSKKDLCLEDTVGKEVKDERERDCATTDATTGP